MPNRTRRRSAVSCAALAALLTAPVVLAAPASATTTTPVIDFNGDGFADLAISAPNATVSGVGEAGYLSVVYGSSAGADTTHSELITRATEGVPGDVTEYDSFGSWTAGRDLDEDGYTDLVVGGYRTPVVLWGSAQGLRGGAALAGRTYDVGAGDINGDGHADLVANTGGALEVRFGPFTRAGVPASTDTLAFDEEDGPQDFTVGDVTGDGKVDVVTQHGFDEMQYTSRLWKGTSTGLSKTFQSSGYYTVGGIVADVNKDGYGDFIARQVDHVSETREYQAGDIRVVYGSASGFSTRTVKINQDSAGVPGVGEAGNGDTDYGDQFGYSLAAGDVTGDGYPDIAVGVPGEDIGSVREAGAVVLLKGGAAGLTGTGAQAFNQSTSGVPGASEKGDNFGASVLLADVNANHRADLAVGTPQEDGTYQNSGAAWLLRGSKTGLTTTNIASFSPSTLNAPEKDSRFGANFAR
ncbi:MULTISPECIES: FG-GAP-like repeat-containing protein [unclassified Streptomyces]|uniref:FG-GAP-like repeat-containing protein n=1 Tax=unclassified Streptomyces TaxID=2593676 RepID=UPI00225885EB|nr:MULTISPECIES: FG-GAP-like repeat-containing protein [unclassified Streptomyces]MCX4990300.1 FG-GAP-like repeat-containing protein [Streptomyces sp. NBC_00568]MCX5004469.1 FG-GAP-like repeat-containing protein [Streptomyces sp. NBC_00638]